MQARIADPMGFAVNPVIVNRPLALEVDQARQGQLRRWLLLFLVLIAAACFDGWQRTRVVTNGFEVAQLHAAQAKEEASSRDLRLELETLRAPSRIAAIATRDLHMVAPSLADVVVIPRVVPPDQPPSSVVASR